MGSNFCKFNPREVRSSHWSCSARKGVFYRTSPVDCFWDVRNKIQVWTGIAVYKRGPGALVVVTWNHKLKKVSDFSDDEREITKFIEHILQTRRKWQVINKWKNKANKVNKANENGLRKSHISFDSCI